MKSLPILIFLMLNLSVSQTGLSQTSDTALLNRMGHLNAAISNAFNETTAAVIQTYYADNAVCMPEYHPAIRGAGAIGDYFRVWFSKTAHRKLIRKQALTAAIYGDYILETGTFTSQFSITDTGLVKYDGYYFRCWTVKDHMPSKIMMEIWGSNSYVDRSVFPQVSISQRPVVPMEVSKDPLYDVVKKRNQLITRLVKERKGEEHARLFSADAIYKPYYMPIQSGTKAITAYFAEHEKPGDVSIDSLTISTGEILTAGTHIIEFGFYKVGWRAGDNSGTVSGKSINVWQKEQDGTWLLGQQMVNHD